MLFLCTVRFYFARSNLCGVNIHTLIRITHARSGWYVMDDFDNSDYPPSSTDDGAIVGMGQRRRRRYAVAASRVGAAKPRAGAAKPRAGVAKPRAGVAKRCVGRPAKYATVYRIAASHSVVTQRPRKPAPAKPRKPASAKPRKPASAKPRKPAPAKPRKPASAKPREPASAKPRKPAPAGPSRAKPHSARRSLAAGGAAPSMRRIALAARRLGIAPKRRSNAASTTRQIAYRSARPRI
jgi:hypothetical protein